MNFDYFFSFGIFWLIILTYKDLKTGKVDSRYNWFMSGITMSIVAIQRPPITDIVIFLGVVIIVSMFISKAVGKGDLTALAWIILGFGFINSIMIPVFFIFMISFTLIHFSIMRFGKITGLSLIHI